MNVQVLGMYLNAVNSKPVVLQLYVLGNRRTWLLYCIYN